METTIPWQGLAEAYAFLGNSLLKPMTQTSAVGLDPAFWQAFPSFDDKGIEAALAQCAEGAAQVVAEAAERDADPAERAAVEYTRLFVGPPSPAAPPWETMHRVEGASVGFGEATFDMRRRLREAGLAVHNENNQYEDHMGLELLLLSVLCSRAAEAEEAGEPVDTAAIASYLDERPLSWAATFHTRVAEAAPGRYYAALAALTQTLLTWHREQL